MEGIPAIQCGVTKQTKLEAAIMKANCQDDGNVHSKAVVGEFANNDSVTATNDTEQNDEEAQATVIELHVKKLAEGQSMFELVNASDESPDYLNTFETLAGQNSDTNRVSQAHVNVDIDTTTTKEVDDNEEIVITITDDCSIPFDEAAESIALTHLNLSGNQNCYLGNSDVVLNNEVRLSDSSRVNAMDLLSPQDSFVQAGKSDDLFFRSTPKANCSRPNADSHPSYTIPAVNSMSLLSPYQASAYGQMAEGRFDKDFDQLSCSTASFDQCVHRKSLGKEEWNSDDEDGVHTVLLDEHGEYDSEPIPYQTYTDKDGNIYCYNPKNGQFEREIIHEFIKPQCAGDSVNPNESHNSVMSYGDATATMSLQEPVVQNEIMVKLPDKGKEREEIVRKMSNGEYGDFPHIVKISDDGSICDITRWFKNYMPKKKYTYKKRVPEEF